MKEERIQGAACLAAVAILDEVKAPEGWRKVPMWVDIAESYVEANTWEERKRLGKALDAGFFEILLNRKIQIMRLLGSEMADRAIDQFEARFNRAAPDRLNLFALIEAFDVFVGPEGEINLIGVFDEGLDFVEAQKIGKFASDLGRKREFSIAEGTRARKAGRDGARIAVQAFSGDTFGAAPRLDRMAFFDHQNLFLAAIFKQFERGENTRRPRTDD